MVQKPGNYSCNLGMLYGISVIGNTNVCRAVNNVLRLSRAWLSGWVYPVLCCHAQRSQAIDLRVSVAGRSWGGAILFAWVYGIPMCEDTRSAEVVVNPGKQNGDGIPIRAPVGARSGREPREQNRFCFSATVRLKGATCESRF